LVLNLGLWSGGLKLVHDMLPAWTVCEVEEMIKQGTPWTLVAIAVLALLAFLSTAWSLLPSIVREVFPRMPGNAVSNGAALSEGFYGMRLAGEIIRWSMVFALPVSYLALSLDVVDEKYHELLWKYSSDATLWIGVALVAMVAGPGPLRGLALGLRTAV